MALDNKQNHLDDFDVDFDVDFDEDESTVATEVEENQQNLSKEEQLKQEQEDNLLDFGDDIDLFEDEASTSEEISEEISEETSEDEFEFDEQQEEQLEFEDIQEEELNEQEEIEEAPEEIDKEPIETENETEEYKEEPVTSKDESIETNIETSEEENTEEIKDLVLYIITDRNNPSLLSYFRNYGVHVSRIFSNLNEARDVLLMQVEPIRLVIIETGTGRFTNMASRKALIDLMGICDDTTRMSVFYTDTVIKSEVSNAEEIEDKMISWDKYRSSADVLAHILQTSKSENYIYDREDSEDTQTDKNILNITGLKVKCNKSMDLGLPTILPSEINLNMMENTSDEGLLPSYNIRI